eukprot:736707_1
MATDTYGDALQELMMTFMCVFSIIWKSKWMILKYFFFDDTIETCRYGNATRNTMDIYVPTQCTHTTNTNQMHHKCAVLVFSIGSCWIGGNKLLALAFARAIQKAGFISVVVDYPRYPSANVEQQINDYSNAIQWILQNIHKYGGDAKNITLHGYSAAGHVLLNSVYRQLSKGHSCGYKSIILHGTPYDISELYKEFDAFSNLLDRILGTHPMTYCVTQQLSVLVEDGKIRPSEMCPIYIINGEHDTTVTFDLAIKFYHLLKHNGFQATLYSGTGWNHTNFAFKDVTWCVRLVDSIANDHSVEDEYQDLRKWSMSSKF